MNNQKLAVLVLNDVVVFPKNEVRIEYDDSLKKLVLIMQMPLMINI